MKNLFKISLTVLPLLVGMGCEETEPELLVSFEFQLLDEAGNSSIEFTEGENFVFSFFIKNNSSETIIFQSMETEEFLKVYKLDNTEGSPVIDIGKPYENIFCTFQNGYPIGSKDTLKIEIPWQPNPWEPGSPYYSSIFCGVRETPILAKGVYRTGFKSDVIFTKGGAEYNTGENEFEITFKIL